MDAPIPLKKKYELSPPNTSEYSMQDSAANKDVKKLTKSQVTSTSKKSFWRSRVLSSPTTKRTEEQHQVPRKLSKNSNAERLASSSHTSKSRTSSLSQNVNPICLETLDGDDKESNVQNDSLADNTSRCSKVVSHVSNRKNIDKQETITIIPVSTSHPFEASGAPDELVQIRTKRLYDGTWYQDPTDIPRHYSTPMNSNQTSIKTTARSISTPADGNNAPVNVANTT